MENGLAGILGEEIAGAGEYLRAGEIPGRSTGDPGRVPLSLCATAKGGERGTQLASLRQVFLVLQRSYPRAKRKPTPRINVLPPGISLVRCHSGSKPRRVHVLVRFRELAGLLPVEVFSRDNMLGESRLFAGGDINL